MNRKPAQFEYGFYADSLRECAEKFGGIFSLPIIPNNFLEMAAHYSDGNVLDIGAGKDKPFLSLIAMKLKHGRYYSMDSDPCGSFDFRTLDEIPRDLDFSLIVANQVYEHLEVQESIDMMSRTAAQLCQGGRYVVTVPNILHPNRQISNITHKTAWGYNSLYMCFKYAGLSPVKIARYSKKHPEGLIEKILARYISRIYRMDWCDSILMVGIKNDK